MEMLSEAEKEKTPPSAMTPLPDDVIMECIAPRVPRSYHPNLSLVSKQFRSLVASRRLYKNRSLLGCTEECVYVLIEDTEIGIREWYSLNRRTKRNMPGTVENRLVPILSLPATPVLASYAVVGSNIFVMGGEYGYHDGRPSLSSIALCIDCRTHTARFVADMPVVVRKEVCKVIDEKIYVVGKAVGRPVWGWTGLMVFDSRTETWEHGTKQVSEVDHRWLTGFSWAAGKDSTISLGKCLTDDIMHYRLWENECVMGNILYVYDGPRNKYILRTYDLKQRTWGVVKGLEKLPLGGYGSHIVCCGKTLILFSTKVLDDDGALVRKRKIWCVEITVEGREDGEIWGKVECCDLLLDGRFAIWNCSVVTL